MSAISDSNRMFNYAYHNEPPCYPFAGEVKQAWEESLPDNYKTQAPPDFWDFTRFNPVYFQRLETHFLTYR